MAKIKLAENTYTTIEEVKDLKWGVIDLIMWYKTYARQALVSESILDKLILHDNARAYACALNSLNVKGYELKAQRHWEAQAILHKRIKAKLEE